MRAFAVLFTSHPLLEPTPAEAPGWVALCRIERDGRIVRLENTGWIAADTIPEPVLVLIGWSDDQRATLEEVAGRLMRDGRPASPPILICDSPPAWQALLLTAVRGFGPQIAAQSRLLAQTALDLARLRIAHQDLQESFAALERYVLASGRPPMEEVFVNPAQSGFVLPRQGAASQLLPVSSAALAAIALHVAAADPASSAGLDLCLHALSWAAFSRAGGCRWLAQAPAGSGSGLAETLSGPPRSLVLGCTLSADASAFRLSCGPEQPLADFRLKDDAGADLVPHSLALRCFVAPPGLRLVHPEGTLLLASCDVAG